MPTVDLTTTTFQDTVSGDGTVLVDFWAEWCGPCTRFGPIFEEAPRQQPDIVFGKVDTESEQGLAGEFQIRSVPTLMAFREGVLVYERPEALSGPPLDQLIEAVGALDMAEMHRQVAEAEGTRSWRAVS